MLMEKNLDIPEPSRARTNEVLVGLPSARTDAKIARYIRAHINPQLELII